jgi:hypothetical protein
MRHKPKIGDVVCLNDHGMDQIGGLRSADAIRQAQRMTIVDVEEMVEGKVWAIDVDQPAIDMFLIDNLCVDLLEPFTGKARAGIEAQNGLNDTWPGDKYP